jgi:hypothetical protein
MKVKSEGRYRKGFQMRCKWTCLEEKQGLGFHSYSKRYITFEYVLSRVLVTIDGVWIGEQIYWTLTGRTYKQL